MTRDPKASADVLDYASVHRPKNARARSLARLAIVISVLCLPCVGGLIVPQRFIIDHFAPANRDRALQLTIGGLSLTSIFLGSTIVVHLHRQRARKHIVAIAWTGVAISVAGLLLFGLWLVIFSGIRLGPGD
jgi:hypothetical protein